MSGKGLVWTENYSCYRAKVGPHFAIGVSWSHDRKEIDADEPWRVSFGDVRLKRGFATLDEGKAAGIRLARRVLTEALNALPGDEAAQEGAP